jgi:hypothetical protein
MMGITFVMSEPKYISLPAHPALFAPRITFVMSEQEYTPLPPPPPLLALYQQL